MRCESQKSNTMFSPVLHPYLPWKKLTHLLSHLLKAHQWLLNALTAKATGYKVPVRLGPCSDLSLLFSLHCSRRKPLGFLSASQIESSFPVWRHCTLLCIVTYCLSTHASPCSYVSFRPDLNMAPLWESTMSHSSKFSPTPTLDPLLSFIVCTHYVCLKWLNRLLTEDRPTCLVHHFYQARSSCFVAKHYSEWLYWVLPCSWGCQGLQRLNDLCQVTLPASGRAGMWT